MVFNHGLPAGGILEMCVSSAPAAGNCNHADTDFIQPLSEVRRFVRVIFVERSRKGFHPVETYFMSFPVADERIFLPSAAGV